MLTDNNATLYPKPNTLNTDQLEKNISAVLERYNATSSRLLLAISGGADSMAMLTSLSSLCASAISAPPRENIQVIHVNHNIRPENECKGDADFVSGFCKERNIPCTVITIPQGKVAAFAWHKGVGMEAAARHFRRKAFLREAARMGDNILILTAHTKDDALELALMRVLRGAGPAGLCAMPVKRGRFLRPLLETTRAEVLLYLSEKKIPWREDLSNTDEKYLRNRIRHSLIPLLDVAFPSWKKGVTGVSRTQTLVAEFVATEAKERIVWIIGSRELGVGNGLNKSETSSYLLPTPHSPFPTLTTDEANFFSQPQILREEAVYQALNILSKEFHNLEPRRSVIRRFCSGEIIAVDLGKARLIRKNGKITLSPVKKDFFESGISLREALFTK